jgi:hypothetical protein
VFSRYVGVLALFCKSIAFFFDLVIFMFVFAVWHSWASPADGKSWSDVPVTGTAPSTS